MQKEQSSSNIVLMLIQGAKKIFFTACRSRQAEASIY